MNTLRVFSLTLLMIVAINALIAGYAFMTNSDGSDLGMTTDTLQYSPFSNYFFPGLILFVVNGLFNLVAFAALFFKLRNSHLFLLIQGILLFGWIVIQVILLRQFHALHFILGAIGLFFMWSAPRLRLVS